MAHTTKALLLVVAALASVIAGIAASLLAKSDGASPSTTIRAGAIGFGSTLTLQLLAMTTYLVL